MTFKKFMFVNRRARQDSARTEEMLEAAVMAAAFGQEVHLAFLDDGVFLLLAGRATEGGALAGALAAPADHDIEHVWVERDSLAARGLGPADLTVAATPVDAPALAALMAEMDVIISV